MTDTGIYLHIPFCNKKCTYCDFYSVFANDGLKSQYVGALKGEIKKWGGTTDRPIDTIYMGGGTPSLLNGDVVGILDTVRGAFRVKSDAEITAEVNPEDISFLPFAKAAGVNRLSLGAQTFCDAVLKKIGRRHTAEDTVRIFNAARETGFLNISLDLILGLPDSSIKTLDRDIDACLSLSPEHISAYILTKEPNTAMAHLKVETPDSDEQAKQYLHLCKRLEENGYIHYEISNFAKPDYFSRHNLKYWRQEEYIGIGPAAHGFFDGKRYYYERDIKAFINRPQTVFEAFGGDKCEKAMLKLRLLEGFDLNELYEKGIPKKITERLRMLEKAGYIKTNGDTVCLTDSGMLLSNSIITELIFCENL